MKLTHLVCPMSISYGAKISSKSLTFNSEESDMLSLVYDWKEVEQFEIENSP